MFNSEKVGGPQRSPSIMLNFNLALDDCDLVYLGFVSPTITCKGIIRKGDGLMCKKG